MHVSLFFLNTGTISRNHLSIWREYYTMHCRVYVGICGLNVYNYTWWRGVDLFFFWRAFSECPWCTTNLGGQIYRACRFVVKIMVSCGKKNRAAPFIHMIIMIPTWPFGNLTLLWNITVFLLGNHLYMDNFPLRKLSVVTGRVDVSNVVNPIVNHQSWRVCTTHL